MNLPHGPVIEKTSCTHCGDLCVDELILYKEKPFCCEGCKTVYALFTENGLDDFYKLNTAPGTSPKAKTGDRFLYLESEEITEKLADYKDEENLRITLEVPSIHCSSCIWILENLNTLNPGIRHSTVNFNKREVSLMLDTTQTSLKDSAELLAMIGYEPAIRLDKISEKKNKPKKDYSRWYKIGVAGFCFGNIMLLTLPEYFDPTLAEERNYSLFFRIMNIAVALPAILYVSPEFFRSAWASLKIKTLNIDVPIALGLAVIFLRSLYEIITDVGPGYLDSYCGLLFFMSIGRAFQQKTYAGLNFDRDYKSYFPVSAEKIEGEKEWYEPITNLKRGDIIRLRNGEICPADSVLISPSGLFDAAFVTGESKPVKKIEGNKVFAGLKNTGQATLLKIEKDVSQSYLTDLWNNKAFEKSESRIQGITDRLSRYFTPAIFLIAAVSLGFYGFKGDWATGWNAFTAVLIVACPCALALASPFTLGNTLRILGRNRFFLKNAIAVETLAAVNHAVFDKTGTITQTGKEEIEPYTCTLNANETEITASLLKQSSHPLSRNLFRYLSSPGNLPVEEFMEIEGKGLEGIISGKKIRVGSADWCGIQTPDILSEQTLVWVKINEENKGGFIFRNKYRNGLKETLSQFDKSIQFSVISGDHSGEKERLKELFPQGTEFVFKALPEEKPVHIQKLKDSGNIVMMTGDGLNDSGALKTADIGISVSDNLNTFTPASDAILDGNEFSRLPLFMQFTKSSLNVVKAGFALSFLYNSVGLYLAVTGSLTPVAAAILMPMSSITVVSFVTLAVNLVARKMKL